MDVDDKAWRCGLKARSRWNNLFAMSYIFSEYFFFTGNRLKWFQVPPGHNGLHGGRRQQGVEGVNQVVDEIIFLQCHAYFLTIFLQEIDKKLFQLPQGLDGLHGGRQQQGVKGVHQVVYVLVVLQSISRKKIARKDVWHCKKSNFIYFLMDQGSIFLLKFDFFPPPLNFLAEFSSP